MRYFRRSLTIIMMLLMSWMFVMSNMAVADVGGLAMDEQTQHAVSFCDDDACAMSGSSNMSCFQHCDHLSVILFDKIDLPKIDHLRVILSIYYRFTPDPILEVELKPPQILMI